MTSLLPLRTADDDDERDGRRPVLTEVRALPDLGPELKPGPLVPVQGGQMGLREQWQTTVVHLFRVARRRARDLAEREGGLVASLLAARPPSVREQAEYARARNWTPPGHDGGVFEGMGVIYHWLVAVPGVAYHNARSATASRPFRRCVETGVAVITAVCVLILTGHHVAAILTGVGTALVVAAWAAAGWLLMKLTGTPALLQPAPDGDAHGTEEDF
jgi:hypothetical protein